MVLVLRLLQFCHLQLLWLIFSFTIFLLITYFTVQKTLPFTNFYRMPVKMCRTFSITTFSITTLSTKGFFATFSINGTQHKWHSVQQFLVSLCWMLFWVSRFFNVLSEVLLSILMLSVIVLGVMVPIKMSVLLTLQIFTESSKKQDCRSQKIINELVK